MRYEKRMIILTGDDGKGVVLIEKSGLGVKFALRTFGIKKRHGIKIGIVTPKRVIVRDIEVCDDPGAVFYLDDVDTAALHFALFDDRIILYGTTCKPMWESNLFDLLNKYAQPVRIEPSPKVLPPLAAKPETLPLPDGTGIPQSRAALYGDEALSDDDFYTPLDLSSRMPEVDRFLDSPRVLGQSLAPTLSEPKSEHTPEPKSEPTPEPTHDETTTAKCDETPAPEPQSVEVAAPEPTVDEQEASVEADAPTEKEEQPAEPVLPPIVEQAEVAAATVATEQAEVAAAETVAAVETAPTSETAENAEVRRGELPWEHTARWLRSRSTRKVASKTSATVPKPEPRSEVKHVRVSTFFERSREDVEKLFSCGTRNAELSALMPEIEWVRVKFDGHTVSVGRGGDVFLCYAIAGEYEKVSPLGPEAQWLPKLKTAPTGKGYWLIFQDLKTGKILDGAAY